MSWLMPSSQPWPSGQLWSTFLLPGANLLVDEQLDGAGVPLPMTFRPAERLQCVARVVRSHLMGGRETRCKGLSDTEWQLMEGTGIGVGVRRHGLKVESLPWVDGTLLMSLRYFDSNFST